MRKCAYTGKDAESKDSVIPKKKLEQEIHNWTKEVPVCNEYKNEKTDRMPTDLEMDIQETFYLLELARMRVLYLENKLEKLQSGYKGKPKSEKPTKSMKKKESQIKKAHHVDEVLDKRKNMWD
jgi:hypothetical protein